MICPIVLHPDPILQEPCTQIPSPDDFWNLRRDLLDTLSHYGGYGLASPQIGKRWRVFICKGIFCVSPIITRVGGSTSIEEEGCLSVPDVYVLVERPDWIKVKFTTLTGEKIESKLNGFSARVFQHELDHLDGILILSKGKIVESDNKTKKA